MTKERSVKIRNITPDASTWTAMLIPAVCDFVTIINQTTQDIKMRTDDGNAASEFTIPVGESYPIILPVTTPGRFSNGDPIGYFQLSAAGSGNVIGVFAL